MAYDYHLWPRETPDQRDDHEDSDPSITGMGQGGRLGLNKFSDNDSDDAEMDCEMIHHRQNPISLPSSVPDPYFKRGSRH